MVTKVLFVCAHNSARSQMAEAYLKNVGGEKFEVESAGLKAGLLSPFAVAVMKEDGIDISDNKTKKVFDFFKQGKFYHYVIAVCSQETSERCPIFPGVNEKINWSFPDPALFSGTEEEKLQETRKVRDQIKKAVENFVEQVKLQK